MRERGRDNIRTCRSATRTCSADGTWDGTEPFCRSVVTSLPSRPCRHVLTTTSLPSRPYRHVPIVTSLPSRPCRHVPAVCHVPFANRVAPRPIPAAGRRTPPPRVTSPSTRDHGDVVRAGTCRRRAPRPRPPPPGIVPPASRPCRVPAVVTSLSRPRHGHVPISPLDRPCWRWLPESQRERKR